MVVASQELVNFGIWFLEEGDNNGNVPNHIRLQGFRHPVAELKL